jgi:hypothetical protein
MIPKTLKVGGYTVKVTMVPNLMTDCAACGQYLSRTKEIQLDPDLCPEQLYSTYLHEIVECICEIYELESLLANHHDIVILAEVLHQILRDQGDVILP